MSAEVTAQLDPGPLLAAVEAFQGSFFDLERGQYVGPDAFARGWHRLSALLSQHELRPGDRVVMAVGNGPLFPAALAAIVAQGGTPLLLHALTPPSELQRHALQLGARFVLHEVPPAEAAACFPRSELLQGDEQAGAGFATVVWSHVDEAAPGFEPGGSRLRGVPLHPTSGSTGQSKIAVRPGFCCMEEARHYIETLQVGAGDSFLVCVPMSHAYGYGMGTMVPLLSGARVVTQRRFNPRSALRAFGEQGITVFPAAPAMLELMLQTGKWPDRPPRYVLSAGAPLPGRLAATFHEQLGTRVRSLYGTTETGGISIDMDDGTGVSGCVGRPMEGVAVEVRPSEGTQELGSGVGQLWVRSSSMMAGYLQPDGLDELALHPGWFPTGDLARLEPSGSIHLLAREKEIINVFGLKVVPSEVESILCALDGVVEAKVYAGVNRLGSQIVKAALVLSPPLQVSAVRAYCDRHLAPFKRPQVIHVLPALPRSPAGKILQEQLP
ncbi:MAG: class I adenylate-forming enzyme family protein [Archangium sp.]